MNYKAVIIGGSAGSFQVVTRILNGLPKSFPVAGVAMPSPA